MNGVPAGATSGKAIPSSASLASTVPVAMVVVVVDRAELRFGMAVLDCFDSEGGLFRRNPARKP